MLFLLSLALKCETVLDPCNHCFQCISVNRHLAIVHPETPKSALSAMSLALEKWLGRVMNGI